MVFDQVLTGKEFVRVADSKLLLLVPLRAAIKIFLVEIRTHFTPDFDALHIRQVPLLL
jgi:hypothetical protein